MWLSDAEYRVRICINHTIVIIVFHSVIIMSETSRNSLLTLNDILTLKDVEINKLTAAKIKAVIIKERKRRRLSTDGDILSSTSEAISHSNMNTFTKFLNKELGPLVTEINSIQERLKTLESEHRSIKIKKEHLICVTEEMGKEIRLLTTKLNSVADTQSATESECPKSDDSGQSRKLPELEKLIEEQNNQIELHERKQRAKYLIVNGIEETVEVAGKIREICCATQVDLDLDKDISTTYRLGKKQAGKARPVRIVLADLRKRNTILQQAWKLRNVDGMKGVYVNADLTPLQQRECKRLRQRRDEERGKPENRGKDVRIQKGRLFIDGKEIDSTAQNFQ